MVEFGEDEFGNFDARVLLKSWIGFRDASNSYDVAGAPGSDGRVWVRLNRDDVKTGPPTPYDIRCVRYLLDHEADVTDALLGAILTEYPLMREHIGEEEAVASLSLPALNIASLRPLIGVHCIYVGFLAEELIPYLGFELGCAWVPEHGLGIMMHGTRPVEIGLGETAFNAHVAENDRLLRNVRDLLERRLSEGRYDIVTPKGLWRAFCADDRQANDLIVTSKAGGRALVVDIRGFFDNPRRNEDDLAIYDEAPEVTSVLWLCPAPPMAVLWTRETGEDLEWTHSEVIDADSECRLPSIGVKFSLRELFGGLEISENTTAPGSERR